MANTKWEKLQKNHSDIDNAAGQRSVEVFQEPLKIWITESTTSMAEQPEWNSWCEPSLISSFELKIKEALHIKFQGPTLNRQLESYKIVFFQWFKFPAIL